MNDPRPTNGLDPAASRQAPAKLLTVLVLTLNEERHLARCLESTRGLDCEIVVVDSGSTDRTAEIARSYGARVIEHPFVTQAQQLNWALDTISLDTDWILRLDADEYLLPELADEIASTLRNVSPDVTAFEMKRRAVFRGRWIKHGGYYPTWLLRLFRRGVGRSEDLLMNEHLVVDHGRVAKLRHDFVNDELLTIGEWTRKHVAYAERQARVYAEGSGAQAGARVNPSITGSSTERRRWLLVNVYGRSPRLARAFAYFLWRYVLRLGFLDGREGLVFHFLHACWYRFLTDVFLLDIEERRLAAPGTSVRIASSADERTI